MRFRIIKKQSNDFDNEKEEDKDTETRQSSANKYSKSNSFKDMVKNSYEFYLSLGKDKLKAEQEKIAEEKEEKIKKLLKREKIAEERQHIKYLENEAINKNLQEKKEPKPKKEKPIAKPSRKSLRVKAPVSYVQKSQPITDQEIFDVLNIESDDNSYNQLNNVESQEKVKEEKKEKTGIILEKLEKLKQEFIFEEEGTYEIGIAHEALLRVQKFIDEHINFKHEIRQCRSVEIGNLLKYVKSHGFSTFDESKFEMLMKINPFLYSLIEGPENSTCLMTFKLNGLEIEKRLESTRRRMTQVSIPELFT